MAHNVYIFCIMLIFCSSFLVGMISRFCTLTLKFFSSEFMTSWKFRSVENPAPKGRNVPVVSRNMSTWVGQYASLEPFCLSIKVHHISFAQVEGVVVDQAFFQMFYMSIRSGDIRDQSRKLSEIAQKFERFLPSQILGGGPYKNCIY